MKELKIILVIFLFTSICFSAPRNRQNDIDEASKYSVIDAIDHTIKGMNRQVKTMNDLSKKIANMDAIYYNSRGEGFVFEEDRTQNLSGEQENQIREYGNKEKIYDPSNPYADKNGFVYMPKTSFTKVLTDWSLANKYFEANVSVYKTSQQMAQQVVDLGK